MVCARCGEQVEASDGFCQRCSRLDSVLAEGCVHCRDEEPILCEGFCVHCGREVRGDRAKLGESGGNSWAMLPAIPRDSPRGNQSGSGLTYCERLSVAWFLIWRGLIIVAAISLGTGLFVRITAFGRRTVIEGLSVTLILLPTLLIGMFVVMPWLVRTLVKKRFRSFSLVVLREQAGSDTCPPQ